MSNQLYHFLINAADAEGQFYQNFYTFGASYEDAVDKSMHYLTESDYKQIEINEYEIIDVNELPGEEIVQYDDFDGYIQNIKFMYDEEE